MSVKMVGIFEAKTKFTALCEEVVRTGLPTLVQKRGQPLVMISPAPAGLISGRADILSDLREWESSHDQGRGDFPEVWKMRGAVSGNPLEE